jgi:hypothetical protein
MITHEIHGEQDLTVHTCRGRVTTKDLISAIRTLYDSAPTPHHLWDLTEADISHIAGREVREIAEFPTRYVPARVGGKTAIVCPSAAAFGLARMYEALAESVGQKATIRAFRSLAEASAWLDL